MQAAITQLFHAFPKGAFKTGTTDRSKEFACFSKIQAELGLTLYFADAYSSWQRGSNENSNGLLREFYPKKTDLAKVNPQKRVYPRICVNSKNGIKQGQIIYGAEVWKTGFHLQRILTKNGQGVKGSGQNCPSTRTDQPGSLSAKKISN